LIFKAKQNKTIMSQFFTTTDLINRINSSLEDNTKTLSSSKEEYEKSTLLNNRPKFELQRRFSDGTTRKASPEETAAADFQSKLKQAGQIVSHLDRDEKLQWAREQRQLGNTLFQEGKCKEAMDVYLTCLVALDYQSKDHDCEDDQESRYQMDIDIKMPVLLNLAACALSLGMYRKTVSFCDFCMELECAKKNPKVYFRRGKAYMSMGNYSAARKDLNTAYSILSEELDDESKECLSIRKEMHRLDQMMKNSKKNKERQAKAMKKWMDGNKEKGTTFKIDEQKKSFDIFYNRYFVFYIKMVERGLRKMLYWLGDEDALTRSYLDDDDNDDDKSRKEK
jgi:tetratricopeptide (TPR) repeat protein